MRAVRKSTLPYYNQFASPRKSYIQSSKPLHALGLSLSDTWEHCRCPHRPCHILQHADKTEHLPNRIWREGSSKDNGNMLASSTTNLAVHKWSCLTIQGGRRDLAGCFSIIHGKSTCHFFFCGFLVSGCCLLGNLRAAWFWRWFSCAACKQGHTSVTW